MGKEPKLHSLRDAARTKAEILRAAALAFSRKGYTQAVIRQIAADVGVDPALVLRYFGNKEKLFAAALAEHLESDPAFYADRAKFGQVVVEALCREESDRLNPVSMMILATSNDDSKAVTQTLLQERAISRLETFLGPPQAAERAALITMLLTGFTLYRSILPLEAFRDAAGSQAALWLSETLQALVDGDGFYEPRRRPRARSASSEAAS